MNEIPDKPLEQGIQTLASKGLNLFAILPYSKLQQSAQQSLSGFDFPLSEATRVILIGHAGQSLWQKLQIQTLTQSDPVDYYSHMAAQAFAEEVLADSDYQIIYPGDKSVALQQLGALAGWHTPSPLGLGINPRWGVWYAYRAALLTNAPLPVMLEAEPDNPCNQCADKPCITHCPAGALAENRQIDMTRCACYRLSEQSACTDRCLARISCPVSTQHRYTLDQIQYHYRLSLETLRHYYQ
ncbi:MAG: hypothetical protein OQL17_02050 [Sedimenticola sp.]|nr:hypothetical protein [Sedimenticola sp.]MCW8948219.1 hypothetical protein [Sedimenticola sp.]MCW8948737.1 hypothetical protein [Sedimenticola sp.]MCW8976060.1 hypothetical protein [Sedimenticola sp.]